MKVRVVRVLIASAAVSTLFVTTAFVTPVFAEPENQVEALEIRKVRLRHRQIVSIPSWFHCWSAIRRCNKTLRISR